MSSSIPGATVVVAGEVVRDEGLLDQVEGVEDGMPLGDVERLTNLGNAEAVRDSAEPIRAARTALAFGPVIVWLNGTHGAGKTTTSALVQQLIPDSRVFDAEKVGETLMDITPGLPETGNFQHWPPWRPLVVETARHVLDYTGGTLVMPMTVLVEQYWREISTGLARHAIPVRHFVLHADQDTLRARIAGDTVIGPDSPFRLEYLEPYAEAARTWLHGEAEVIDTTHLTPAQAAQQIAEAVKS